MTRQHARSHRLNSIAGAAIVWLGILLLLGNLDRAVPQLGNLLYGTAREGLRVLPSIVLAAWQAVQAHGLDHHRHLGCSSKCCFPFGRYSAAHPERSRRGELSG
jgi:hypothetical protein